MDCSMPDSPVLPCLPEFAQIHVHWVGDAIYLCHSLLPTSPFAFHLSQHWESESVLYIRWPKYWSFSFTFSPSNEYSRLISFRIDWFDLLAVQGTLKSLLQHHSSKASVIWRWAFFMIQLSYPYLTAIKTIALTVWTLVHQVMSLFCFLMIYVCLFVFGCAGSSLLRAGLL